MEYRTLGRTGCSVSPLCLGTMTFGKETDEPEAHAQLDAFFEAGGNLGSATAPWTRARKSLGTICVVPARDLRM